MLAGSGKHEKKSDRLDRSCVLRRLVFELREQALTRIDIIARAEIHRLMQGIAVPIRVEIPHLDNCADCGDVVIGRDGDVAAGNQVPAPEQTNLHASLGIYSGNNRRQ